MDLNELGFTKEELQQRVVDQVARSIMNSSGYDEYGDEHETPSAMVNQIKTLVKERVDTQVAAIAEESILPQVASYIENVCLQHTNRWGEATGEGKTFIEYLTERAEAYLSEPVSFHGKTKGEDNYNWSKNTTRLAYMVDKHLQYSIERALSDAVKSVNDQIVGSLTGAVEHSLKEIVGKLKTTVKVK